MKKILSMFLALCMIFTLLPVAALAEEAHTTIGASGEIIAFALLAETEKKVTVGTSIQDLELPETLTATVRMNHDSVTDSVYGSEYEETLVNIPVTWTSQPEYDMDTEGVYIFTPVIEGYTVSAELPEIAVTVGVAMRRGMVSPMASTSYNIWVGGVQVTDDNKGDITGPGITGTITYDSDTNTLILNDANITKAYTGWGGDTFCIYSQEIIPLTLKLIGDNFITGADSVQSTYGIRCRGELTIEGGGSLTVTPGKAYITDGFGNNHSSGILTQGGLTINDVTLDIQGEQFGIYEYGSGDITINGGTIIATGKKTGIFNSDSLIISSGNVTGTATTSGGYGISTNHLTVSGDATVTAMGTDGAIGYNKLTFDNDYVHTNFADSNADGIEATFVNDATLTRGISNYKYVKIMPTTDVAQIGNKGYATLQGAIYEVKDGDTIHLLKDTTENINITNNNSFTIDLNGKTLSNTSGHVIEKSGSGKLTITDSNSGGKVECTSTSPDNHLAIYNKGTGEVIIKGGTISAYKMSIVSNNGMVSIYDGTISSSASNAIQSDNTVNVYGGTVISAGDSGNSGIRGNIVNVMDGMVVHTNGGHAIVGNAVSISGGTIKNNAEHGITIIISSISLTLTGGTIENSHSNGTAIYAGSTSSIRIPSGTVTIKGGGKAMDVAPDLSGYANVRILGSTTSADVTEASEITKDDIDTKAEVEAYKYLEFGPATAPGAPTNLTATPGDEQLTLTWTAPTSTGFSPITYYEYSINGGASWESTGSTSTNYIVAGLTNGTSYTIKVRAINVIGEGAESASITAAPAKAAYSITATAGAGGSISPSGSVTVDNNGLQRFEIIPNSNYSIADVTVDGVSQGKITSYTFHHVTSDHTISATFNYSGGGGSGSSGGSGSDRSSTTDNSSHVIVIPPAPHQPDSPTQGQITVPGTVDSRGNVTVSITGKTVTDAFDKALADAKKNGNEQNGITVVLRVDTSSKASSKVTVNLPKTVQDTIIANKIVTTIVIVDNPDIKIGMDLSSVKEINQQAQSDVNITATRTDSGKLNGEAKNAIGSRPVFDLNVNYGSGQQVQDFGAGSVSVTIPYTLGANEKAENVCAVYVDSNGAVHWLTSSVYDSVNKVLRFSTNHFSTYGVGYKEDAPVFTDITGHWAKEDIEFVVNQGLFSGTSATTFSPNTAMTRGMFVTVLGRLANADVSGYKQSSFTDVKSDLYYMSFIEWASKNSIVTGTGNGTFAPDQAISREQMAVIISNYAKTMDLKLTQAHGENTFADNAKISVYAKDAVKQMQMAGILSGKNGNLFDPQGTATRAEVSAVMHRFVEVASSSDTI